MLLRGRVEMVEMVEAGGVLSDGGADGGGRGEVLLVTAADDCPSASNLLPISPARALATLFIQMCVRGVALNRPRCYILNILELH